MDFLNEEYILKVGLKNFRLENCTSNDNYDFINKVKIIFLDRNMMYYDELEELLDHIENLKIFILENSKNSEKFKKKLKICIRISHTIKGGIAQYALDCLDKAENLYYIFNNKQNFSIHDLENAEKNINLILKRFNDYKKYAQKL